MQVESQICELIFLKKYIVRITSKYIAPPRKKTPAVQY